VLSSRSEHLGVARVPDRAKPSDCDTVAYIPARLASERVPRKNLRLLGDYPLISYVSKAALRASSIDRVYVNTESSEIAAVAKTIGVEVYWRAARLAAGPVTTDEILYDFAKAIDCRTLVVINPTAPFLKPETIDRVLSATVRPTPLCSRLPYCGSILSWAASPATSAFVPALQGHRILQPWSTSTSSCLSYRERKPSLNMSAAGIVSTYRRWLSFLCPASSVSISTRKMTSYSQRP
jgi:hypothetical protein